VTTIIVNDSGFIQERHIAPEGATHAFRSLRSAEASAVIKFASKIIQSITNRGGRRNGNELIVCTAGRDEKSGSDHQWKKDGS